MQHHTVTISGNSRFVGRDSRTMATVAEFDSQKRIHFNPNFWQWYTDGINDRDDARTLGGFPKLTAHENIHQGLNRIGAFAASKALDNRELFGTFETQSSCGIKIPEALV